MKMKALIILASLMLTQEVISQINLPEKPLLTEITAYNLSNVNRLELGDTKEKVIEIMGGVTIIKGYYSKDWKDYLTGLETKDIPNPYRMELFVNAEGKNTTILWYYVFPNKTQKLIPLKFENNLLVTVGLDTNQKRYSIDE